MDTKKAIETMLTAAGCKKQDIAKKLNIALPSFTIWLNKLNQVERLLKIASICDFEIVLRNKNGLEIKLSPDQASAQGNK